MWINKLVFFGFICTLVACEKENLDWDKEANLHTDTSIFIRKAEVVSFTDSEIICDFEIVQLNKLDTEFDYSNIHLAAFNAYDFNYLFSDFSVESHIPFSSYSTLILMEATSFGVFAEGQAAPYFSRFFEQNQAKSPQKNIGLVTFRSDHVVDLKFHKESDFLYGNSASFNDSVMTDLIRNAQRYTTSYNADNDFRDLIFTVIDTLVANPATVGDRSITLVDDYLNNNQGALNDSVLQAIVDKAVLNNVKINIICLGGLYYYDLAFKTGGFLIDGREAFQTLQSYSTFSFSSVANGIANLDRILSNDVTSFNFRLSLNNSGQFTIFPNYNAFVSFSFNTDYYQFNMRMP